MAGQNMMPGPFPVDPAYGNDGDGEQQPLLPALHVDAKNSTVGAATEQALTYLATALNIVCYKVVRKPVRTYTCDIGSSMLWTLQWLRLKCLVPAAMKRLIRSSSNGIRI